MNYLSASEDNFYNSCVSPKQRFMGQGQSSHSVHHIHAVKRDRADEDHYIKFAQGRVPDKVEPDMQDVHIYDQNGSACAAACAVAAAVNIRFRNVGSEEWVASDWFIYYNARKLEGTTELDCGCSIRDALQAASREGICKLHLHSSSRSDFDDAPSAKAYKDAAHYKITSYGRVGHQSAGDKTTHEAIKVALAANCTCIARIAIFEANPEHGLIKVQDPKVRIGTTAVLIIGFDDTERMFHFQNSHGKSWGQSGFGSLPYNFVDSPALCDDIWTITGDSCFFQEEESAYRDKTENSKQPL